MVQLRRNGGALGQGARGSGELDGGGWSGGFFLFDSFVVFGFCVVLLLVVTVLQRWKRTFFFSGLLVSKEKEARDEERFDEEGKKRIGKVVGGCFGPKVRGDEQTSREKE